MNRALFSVALLSLFACLPASAGQVTGTIVRIEQIVYVPGRPFMLVAMTGTVNVPPPACNTSNRFAIDLTTTGGQEAASLAKLLYATGRTARIGGGGLCDVYNSSETALEVDGF